MPELPEVEHLRRTLEPLLINAKVRNVELRRADVLRIVDQAGKMRRALNPKSGAAARRSAELAHALLNGARITELIRHGKNLAIITDVGRVLCVHLGMSGQLMALEASSEGNVPAHDHVHCVWRLERVAGTGARSRNRQVSLVFRDPRRFGGLWAFESPTALWKHRFNALGPDALHIRASNLARNLAESERAIKAALLDQTVLAGVGNIYADEALFRSHIHPAQLAGELSATEVAALAQAIRTVLREAVQAGGSSIRDYVDGAGRAGEFSKVHQVYGRAGEPCGRCGRLLQSTTIAQRTTVFCEFCQGATAAEHTSLSRTFHRRQTGRERSG